MRKQLSICELAHLIVPGSFSMRFTLNTMSRSRFLGFLKSILYLETLKRCSSQIDLSLKMRG